MALGRGLFGAIGKRNAKGWRKGPALVAVVAGLGAAGAAALKRRRSGEQQPMGGAPTEPGAPATAAAHEAGPPAGAA